MEEGEALTARNALKIALEAGLSNLVLEMDNLKLYYVLINGRRENNSFRKIV